VDRLEVLDLERLGVGDDQVVVGRVLLDGVDHAAGRQLGGLDGDRPAAGADVPDDAGRLHVEAGQGDGADLGLGDEPAFGPALGEDVVGVAEPPLTARRAAQIGSPGLAFEDHHVERRELHLGDLAQLGLRDPLVRTAEVLANVGAEVIEAAGQQLPGDLRRAFVLVGEQPDGLGGADAVKDVFEAMRRQVGEVGFFPRLLDAGKRKLHRADVRQHVEFLLAEPVA
jgi:hypothetical protein